MKKIKVLFVIPIAVAWLFSVALATNHTAEERGEAHFKNPNFAGGQKACNTCHPDGKGLSKAGEKTTFKIMGGKQNSLEEANNVCIVNANKGQAIDEKSDKMQELVSYIKSLGKKAAPGYGRPGSSK